MTGASPPASLRLGSREIPYGWVIVAALSVTETVTWGVVYYGFPVFLRPMEQDLGASRVAVTGAFSVGLGVSALAALPVGRWIDRHGARGLMTAGSCLATLLMFAWTRIESLPALYAVWFGLGVAMAATLYEPAFAAVVSWFPRDLARDDEATLAVEAVGRHARGVGGAPARADPRWRQDPRGDRSSWPHCSRSDRRDRRRGRHGS